MSELHDSSIRVRRKRRRRSPSRERDVPIPSTPLQRSLLWATVTVLSLSLVLFIGMVSPGGVGVGSLQPSFRVEGGRVTMNNEGQTTWSGVSVRAFGLLGGRVESTNTLYAGASQDIEVGGCAPFVVWVRGERAGGEGFWLGVVY